MRHLAHPYVLLALAAFFWGANAVAGKLALGHISPMALTALRWAVATLLVLPFAWPRLKVDWPLMRRHLPYFFLMGAVGMTLFNALLYTAVIYTSAVQATIVQSSMPLVVFLGMFVFFRVRVLPVQLLGFALTAAGVALTAARGDPAALLSLDLNYGDALMLGAVLCYGGYTVALGRKPPVHWLTTILALCVGAFLSALPLLVWEIERGGFIAPDARGWAIALFVATLPSLGSQVFYIRGVETIGANRANLFVNFVPIFGAGLAIAILGEPLLAYHLAALALVIGGITIANARKGRPGRPPLPISLSDPDRNQTSNSRKRACPMASRPSTCAMNSGETFSSR